MNRIGLFIVAVAVSLPACERPKGQPANAELDSAILTDDPARYKTIQDANDWLNPFLVIRRDGVAVRCAAVSRDTWQTITAGELREKLLGLPIGAWPYGRVVAVQEIGIQSRDDARVISSNLAAVSETLTGLGVRINHWPSA